MALILTFRLFYVKCIHKPWPKTFGFCDGFIIVIARAFPNQVLSYNTKTWYKNPNFMNLTFWTLTSNNGGSMEVPICNLSQSSQRFISESHPNFISIDHGTQWAIWKTLILTIFQILRPIELPIPTNLSNFSINNQSLGKVVH